MGEYYIIPPWRTCLSMMVGGGYGMGRGGGVVRYDFFNQLGNRSNILWQKG